MRTLPELDEIKVRYESVGRPIDVQQTSDGRPSDVVGLRGTSIGRVSEVRRTSSKIVGMRFQSAAIAKSVATVTLGVGARPRFLRFTRGADLSIANFLFVFLFFKFLRKIAYLTDFRLTPNID